MANENFEAARKALQMFRDGMSKAEIGKALNLDKKAVSKLIAQAIREKDNG